MIQGLTRIKLKSPWLDYPYEGYEILKENLDTEVAIIGGGITGVSAAYHLSKLGIPFVLLEKDKISHGSSGRSAGGLVPGTELDFYQALETYGKQKAVGIWKFTKNAIKDIERTVKLEKIDCGFEHCDAFYFSKKPKQDKILFREHAATNKYGFETEILDRRKLENRFVTLNWQSLALRYRNEAYINPAKLVYGLARKVDGNAVFERSPVISMKKDGSMFFIKTPSGTVRSRKLIVATESYTKELPFSVKDKPIKVKITAIATEKLDEKFLKESGLKKSMFWDTRVLYNFVRVTSDNRIILTGRDTIVDNKLSRQSFNTLYSELCEFFPLLKGKRIDYMWYGYMGVSPRVLPFIGKDTSDPDLMYSLGYGGHGIPFGFSSGRILSEICAGKEEKEIKEIESILRPVKSNIYMTAIKSALIKMAVRFHSLTDS